MARTAFEELQVYRLSEDVADRVWDIVLPWDNFAKDTVGKQLVRAADSIGANIAEGAGRGAFQDNRRFVRIGRGSLNETKALPSAGLSSPTFVGHRREAPSTDVGRAVAEAECVPEIDRPGDKGGQSRQAHGQERTTEFKPRTTDH